MKIGMDLDAPYLSSGGIDEGIASNSDDVSNNNQSVRKSPTKINGLGIGLKNSTSKKTLNPY